MGNLLSNKLYNYLFALVVMLVLFIILTILLNMAELTDPLWGIGAIICSVLLVLGSIQKIDIRTTSQLVFFGTQTGIWIDEGYYFLFYLFTLDTHESLDKEDRTLIIAPFDLPCVDAILIISFNLKYLQGRSSVENPTEEDEQRAKENFKNQKVADIDAELQDLVESLSLSKCKPKLSKDLSGESISEFIRDSTIFKNECLDYGIKIKSFLPKVKIKNITQEDLDLRKLKLITDYKNEGYTKEEAREMAEIELGQIKVVRGGAGTLGRFDI